MKLSVLLSGIEDVEVFGDLNVEISDVVNNSSLAKNGSLFVAIRGKRVNAEEFLHEAYDNGARAFVVCNKEIKMPNSVMIYSKNTRKFT